MAYIIGIVLLVIGCALGFTFPDADQRFFRWLLPSAILSHRSLLTHGMLVPLLFYFGFLRTLRQQERERQDKALVPGHGLLATKIDNVPLRLFVIGFCVAIAVHLAFDLFPRYWSGYARIHIPFYGWTTSLFSRTWLLAGVFVSLRLACALLRHKPEFFLGAGTLVVMYLAELGLMGSRATYASLPALLVLALTGYVAFIAPTLWERLRSFPSGMRR